MVKIKITTRYLLVYFLLLGSMQAFAEVNFEETMTWAQVKAKARAENKYIFVDVMATWCAPCKWMDREVYPQAAVGSFFNSRFVSVKVQNDVTKNDNAHIRSWYVDARQISESYHVSAFPTMLFLSPDGDLIYKAEGGRTAEELMTDARNALDPAKQLNRLFEHYLHGETDAEFVKTLAVKLRDAGQKGRADSIARNYIGKLTPSQLSEASNALFALDFTENTGSTWFNVLLANRQELISHSGQGEFVRNKINLLIYREAIAPFEFSLDDKPDWNKIKQALSKYGSLGDSLLSLHTPRLIWNAELLPQLYSDPDWTWLAEQIEGQKTPTGKSYVLQQMLDYYLNALPSVKLCTNLSRITELYWETTPSGLTPLGCNRVANVLYEHANTKYDLENALNWSKRCLDKDDNAGYLDTYALILYQLGRKEEAIATEEKALAQFPDNANLLTTLDKMRKGEKLHSIDRKSASNDLIGTWTLAADQSDFGGLVPDEAAPDTLKLFQHKQAFGFTRHFKSNGDNADTLTVNGPPLAINLDNITVSRRLLRSEKNGRLIVWSVYHVAKPGEEPYNFTRAEAYQAADAHKLLVNRLTYLPEGIQKVKAVYLKNN